jgi:GTP cyclohydrolase IA
MAHRTQEPTSLHWTRLGWRCVTAKLKSLPCLIAKWLAYKPHHNITMTLSISPNDIRNQLVTTESKSPVSEAEMQQAVRTLLLGLGEDPDREGLLDTPKRVVKALKFLTSGYNTSIDELLNGAVFHEDANEMVLIRDIDLFSSCEHHILPIIGRAHVAYIPDGKVIGLSKIARICEMYARRLQVQERLTAQIADAIQGLLKPQGVAVVIEATHMCMVMRGVQKPGSWTVTSSMQGVFADDGKTRQEFMDLIRHRPSFH